MDDNHSPTNSFPDEFLESENRLKSFDKERPRCTAPKRRRSGIRKMWLAAFTSLFMALAVGLCTGFSAPATYDMETSDTSLIKPSDKETMWIGSTLVLGVILGSLIAGPVADHIGRKDTLVYNIVPFGFAWIIICYSQTIPVLLFGRLLNGLAVGVILVVVPMYCVEIATTEVRGILGSACQGFLVIGNFLSVTIGAFIPWNYLALNGAVFAIISVMIFCPMPESPRWLLMKNRLKCAVKVMNELQGGFVNAEKECEAIYQDLQNQPKGSVKLSELLHPTSLKPGVITSFIMFFQQFSGINAVFLYSSDIFKVSKDFIDPKIATIILGAVQVVLTLLSNFIVDRSGRKILLILSGGLMGVSFAIFGIFYYMISQDISIEYKYSWIPLTCCVTSVIGYSLGYGPLPFLLSAEMLPVRVRSTMSAIVHVIDGLFAFIITNTFSDFRNLMKSYGTFWFYSVASAVGVLYVIMFVPETKGKKLEEIEQLFVKKEAGKVINISVIS